MLPLEYETNRIKDIFIEMFDLVQDQLTLTQEALLAGDRDVAGEVMRKENRVNSYELTLDRECEDFLALHSPVAADLRLTIGVLKMSASLERIGDHAFRISSYVYDQELSLNKELIKLLELPLIFKEIDSMFNHVIEAFDKGDAKLVKQVFKQDKTLDKINKRIPDLLDEYCKEHSSQKIQEIILISRVVGKLERVGDMLTNMGEEMLFYLESKVVKHKKKTKRIKKRFSLKTDE